MKWMLLILITCFPGCFADSRFGHAGDEFVMPYIGNQVPAHDSFKDLAAGSRSSTEICSGKGAFSRSKLIDEVVEKALKDTGAVVLKNARITSKSEGTFKSCIMLTGIPMYLGVVPKLDTNESADAK